MAISEARTRTRGPIEVSHTFTRDYIAGGTDFTLEFERSSMSESMDDVVTPGYHQLIAAGAIINNPCTYTVEDRSTVGTGHSHFYRDPNYEFYVDGAVSAWFAQDRGLTFITLNTSIEDVEARCKLVALANVDSTPYAFGEDALELKETVRFLRNPTQSLYKLSRSFKKFYKKRKADTGDLVKAHADTWLQYQFAVSPLIRSVSDALEAYSLKEPRKVDRLTSRGFSESSDLVSDQVTLSNAIFNRKVEESLEGHASILYVVSNPVDDWKYRLGFRVKDWPTTIWQVMPYSFMVDRLFDVTSFSKGIINLADPNVSMLAASYSKKHEYIQSYAFVDHTTSGFSVNSVDTVIDRNFSYVRDVWTPSVSNTLPEFKPVKLIDSATKMLDLIALTISNFARV